MSSGDQPPATRLLPPPAALARPRSDQLLPPRPCARVLAATAPQQAAMIGALAESVGCALPGDLTARLYLRPTDWPALVGLGMRVGAHSVHHPRLTQVDDGALQAEVGVSIDALRHLGGPVAFAYPDGAYDERVVRAVRRAAVSSAVTCEPGVVRAGADVLRLPRVFVAPAAAVLVPGW